MLCKYVYKQTCLCYDESKVFSFIWVYTYSKYRKVFCILAVVINLSRVAMAPSTFWEEDFDCRIWIAAAATFVTSIQTRSVSQSFLFSSHVLHSNDEFGTQNSGFGL